MKQRPQRAPSPHRDDDEGVDPATLHQSRSAIRPLAPMASQRRGSFRRQRRRSRSRSFLPPNSFQAIAATVRTATMEMVKSGIYGDSSFASSYGQADSVRSGSSAQATDLVGTRPSSVSGMSATMVARLGAQIDGVKRPSSRRADATPAPSALASIEPACRPGASSRLPSPARVQCAARVGLNAARQFAVSALESHRRRFLSECHARGRRSSRLPLEVNLTDSADTTEVVTWEPRDPRSGAARLAAAASTSFCCAHACASAPPTFRGSECAARRIRAGHRGSQKFQRSSSEITIGTIDGADDLQRSRH